MRPQQHSIKPRFVTVNRPLRTDTVRRSGPRPGGVRRVPNLGRELIDIGYADVGIAAELDTGATVPLLEGGAFRAG